MLMLSLIKLLQAHLPNKEGLASLVSLSLCLNIHSDLKKLHINMRHIYSTRICTNGLPHFAMLVVKIALQKMFIILWMSVTSFIPRLFAALCKEPGVWLWMSGVANSPATIDSLSYVVT